MTERKRSKKMEGEFKIQKDKPLIVKDKLSSRELSSMKRLARVTERFAEAELDPDRGTDDLFLGKEDRCVLLGLRCDNDCPCLQCKVGCTATSEIRYMIDVNLGVLH